MRSYLKGNFKKNLSPSLKSSPSKKDDMFNEFNSFRKDLRRKFEDLEISPQII